MTPAQVQYGVSPDALYHCHDLSWWRSVRQYFKYGRGILFFRLNRRRRLADRFGNASSLLDAFSATSETGTCGSENDHRVAAEAFF